jgi:hypothetical protein
MVDLLSNQKPRVIAMVGTDHQYFYLTFRQDVPYNWNICKDLRMAMVILFSKTKHKGYLPAQPLPYVVSQRLSKRTS